MSQDRIESGGYVPPKTSTDIYKPSDIDGTLARANDALKQVRLVHGANDLYENIEGKTVGWARKKYKEILNLPSDAEAFVAGKSVSDDFILEGSQQLEFTKDAGVKGLIDEHDPPCVWQYWRLP